MKNERKNNSEESQNLVTEEQEVGNFSFFSSENWFEYREILSLTLAQQTTWLKIKVLLLT